ncbi:hypothetical protein SASPL_138252 [Salvia splendens]|uniref:Beta-glucosidase n=1 Tax=Salvia splendens TaxID=180675 RepID=A0A8X8ZDY5_SALSN|nr:hypothetical protein SASPL_138252 [Salvia splendens]
MGPCLPTKPSFVSFSSISLSLSLSCTCMCCISVNCHVISSHYDFGSYKGSCWGQNYEENPSGSSFDIVVVGEGPYVESGGDSSDFKIPSNGAELASVVTDQVPTFVILISGRPLAIEPQLLN